MAVCVAQVSDVENGPREDRTPNPLIKRSLGDDPTSDYDLPSPEIPEDYEP